LLREGIGLVHAALFTHEHADHVMGLDDVRLFPFYLGHAFPLYCEAEVESRIRTSFDYAFKDIEHTHAGAVPNLEIRRITEETFNLLGTRVTPIRLSHGRYQVLGFRFGNVAYCTDTNHIPDESWSRLEGLEVLILDALRRRPHATHFSLDEALQIAARLQPKRTLLTHMCHELEHEATNAALPAGVELAYDGMRVPLW
jgi:phosphoribosyl 1,2-cyclic phosphate phosphodiesterase